MPPLTFLSARTPPDSAKQLSFPLLLSEFKACWSSQPVFTKRCFFPSQLKSSFTLSLANYIRFQADVLRLTSVCILGSQSHELKIVSCKLSVTLENSGGLPPPQIWGTCKVGLLERTDPGPFSDSFPPPRL